MLTVKTLHMNMLEENCHIVSDETKEAVIIDCGALGKGDFKKITDYVESQGLHIIHHLFTHAHYDHCFGAAFIQKTYGAAPEMDSAEAPIYKGTGSDFFGELCHFMQGDNLPHPARFLSDGDEVTFGNHQLKVIATPGHSPGGLCFYCEKEKVLFSGDTLFYGSVGRTDLPGGDTQQLVDNISRKLFTLPDDVTVYTGHGPETQIGFEKKHNPYVR